MFFEKGQSQNQDYPCTGTFLSYTKRRKFSLKLIKLNYIEKLENINIVIYYNVDNMYHVAATYLKIFIMLNSLLSHKFYSFLSHLYTLWNK